MTAFGIKIEGTVRILKYDTNDDFVYEEIESIQSPKSNQINFSILTNLKQSNESSNGQVHILFVHMYEDPDSSKQMLKKISLGTLNLTLNSEEEEDIIYPKNTLRNDPWPVRQTFRWNLSNVPTKGPGSYAVVLATPSEKDPQKFTIIDCAYLEVT